MFLTYYVFLPYSRCVRISFPLLIHYAVEKTGENKITIYVCIWVYMLCWKNIPDNWSCTTKRQCCRLWDKRIIFLWVKLRCEPHVCYISHVMYSVDMSLIDDFYIFPVCLYIVMFLSFGWARLYAPVQPFLLSGKLITLVSVFFSSELKLRFLATNLQTKLLKNCACVSNIKVERNSR